MTPMLPTMAKGAATMVCAVHASMYPPLAATRSTHAVVRTPAALRVRVRTRVRLTVRLRVRVKVNPNQG